ncbi:hypothetical protein BJV77DRAFT_960316 [Russula vinacea]|nr:hypothetical protein BJV77DRAFT_960316 [Russula vinacea]
MTLEDQAEILATRWMSVGQLEEAGISFRRGPFAKNEKRMIDDALQRYQKEHNLNDDQLNDLIHFLHNLPDSSSNGFWSYVACVPARAVPQRGIKQLFYHVRRARNSLGKGGKWSPAEDEHLRRKRPTRRAVEKHGSDWLAIADWVHRSPADCSDRYRQVPNVKTDIFDSIWAWSEEEESQLLHAMKGLAKEGRTDKSARGYWVSVSKALDATRTPKQCQNKWYESLRGKVRNAGKTRRWKHEDSYILICKIASLDLDEEADVDWKSLTDLSWNMWSGNYLQRKWKWLKASCDADDSLKCHRDVVSRRRTAPRSADETDPHSGQFCIIHDSPLSSK